MNYFKMRTFPNKWLAILRETFFPSPNCLTRRNVKPTLRWLGSAVNQSISERNTDVSETVSSVRNFKEHRIRRARFRNIVNLRTLLHLRLAQTKIESLSVSLLLSRWMGCFDFSKPWFSA